MDLVVLAFDDTDGVKRSDFEIEPMNIKAGLLNWMDLQLVLEPTATRSRSRA